MTRSHILVYIAYEYLPVNQIRARGITSAESEHFRSALDAVRRAILLSWESFHDAHFYGRHLRPLVQPPLHPAGAGATQAFLRAKFIYQVSKPGREVLGFPVGPALSTARSRIDAIDCPTII